MWADLGLGADSRAALRTLKFKDNATTGALDSLVVNGRQAVGTEELAALDANVALGLKWLPAGRAMPLGLRSEYDLSLPGSAARANLFVGLQADLATGADAVAAGVATAFVDMQASSATRAGGDLDKLLTDLQ